jgi:hypothetical protein
LKDYSGCVLQALASTLDTEELAALQDQFNVIDVDKSGTITLEEIRQVSIFLGSFICSTGAISNWRVKFQLDFIMLVHSQVHLGLHIDQILLHIEFHQILRTCYF